eukprot:scaffold206276_cov33-Tisochrysis_lutea.AAC.1
MSIHKQGFKACSHDTGISRRPPPSERSVWSRRTSTSVLPNCAYTAQNGMVKAHSAERLAHCAIVMCDEANATDAEMGISPWLSYPRPPEEFMRPQPRASALLGGRKRSPMR